MQSKGITALNVKAINRNNIYNFIYREKATSKQQITLNLQMGISTVSQNIKTLEDEGLIERNGSFDSTGGRKPDMIRIISTARITIGVVIYKKSVLIVAVDLYGEVMDSLELKILYEDKVLYYKSIGEQICQFIDDKHISPLSVLGVSIATQGLVSSDGTSVSYGVILDNYNMKLSSLAKFIPYPCRLEHDCKAAAHFELWTHNDIDTAAIILLNHNVGGSLIVNKRILQGSQMHAGAIEHLCINKEGPVCYCGSRGCLETYCSADILENTSGMTMKSFFEKLRIGEKSCVQIWADYLDKLAFAIRNLNTLIDGHIIISGYLAPYLTEADIARILELSSASPFPLDHTRILVGTSGEFTPAAGAALSYIEEFLKSV